VSRNAEYNACGYKLTWQARQHPLNKVGGINIYRKLSLPWCYWTESFDVTVSPNGRSKEWRQDVFCEVDQKFSGCCRKLTVKFLHDLMMGGGGFRDILKPLETLRRLWRPPVVTISGGRIEHHAYASMSPVAFIEHLVEQGVDTCVLGTYLKQHLQSTSIGRYLCNEADWSGSSIYGLRLIDCTSDGMQSSYLFPQAAFGVRFLNPPAFMVSVENDSATQRCSIHLDLWGAWYPRIPALFASIH
jgi:hypothetical protein